MSNLIIFDIDGTLIHHIDCEDKAYLEAVTSVTGIEQISTVWDSYNYSTDSGVLSEIIQHALNREPKQNEIASIKDRFVSCLFDSFERSPNSCRCIPGAQTVFDAIKSVNWDIAIATGGWQKSAVMKLKTAEIPYREIPMAHSDDHYDRKDIITTAIDRAKDFYGKNIYQNIIYVGDALWDLKASIELAIDFIGIGRNFDSTEYRNIFRINNYETNNLLDHLITF